MKTPMERFWEKVNKTEGCWLWTASTYPGGYGCFSYQGKVVRAHRWLYQQTVGAIPSGMLLCHRCDTPQCVNMDHIFLGTVLDNAIDASKKGRIYKGGANVPWTRALTHCKRGHPLSGDNLSSYTKRRICKACMRLRWKPKAQQNQESSK